MGAPFLAVFAGLAWGADCPDRGDLIDGLHKAVVEADLDAAEAILEDLEDAFGCGSVASAEVLGKMWLLEGAWLTFINDKAGAEDSWNAAERVAPTLWIDDLGDALRDDYENAESDADQGRIDVDPPLFWGSIAAVDGRITSMPLDVEPGLHLVQAGVSGDAISVGKIIVVTANSTAVVATNLSSAPKTTAPEAAPSVGVAKLAHPVRAHIAAGSTVAVGAAIAGSGAGDEPATKVSVPLELGAVRDLDEGWYRFALSVSPLIGGRLLYAKGAQINGSPAGIGGHVAAGWISGPLRVGGLAGVSWPGRITTRAVLAAHLGDWPLTLEARGGLNIATEREPEPALGAVLVFEPYL